MIAPETWNLCVAILTAAGYKEGPSRALIGRQCKDYDEADVVRAYESAAGKADPRAYAAGVLKKCKMKARKVQDQLPLVPAEPPASREKARATIRHSMAILRGREPGED